MTRSPAFYAAKAKHLSDLGLLDHILVICITHRATLDEVLSPARHHRISRARQACFAYVRGVRRTDGRPVFSFPDIGAMFDRADKTVMVGIEEHEKRMGKEAA